MSGIVAGSLAAPQAIGANSVNACCLPGGIVFVHSGLIKAVGGSKQALSFVVGHEVRAVPFQSVCMGLGCAG